jgi:hypothetical protein
MSRDRVLVERWPKLPLAEKKQGRDHAARPECDKHGGNSLGASPSPPIGFQVPHDILCHLLRSTSVSETIRFDILAPTFEASLTRRSGRSPLHLRRICLLVGKDR